MKRLKKGEKQMNAEETEKMLQKMTDSLANHYIQELFKGITPPFTEFHVALAFHKGVEFGAKIMKDAFQSSVENLEKEFLKK
jgi:hypothetical protein